MSVSWYTYLIRYISVLTVAGAVCKKILVKYVFRLLRIRVSLTHMCVVVQGLALTEHLLLYLLGLFSASH